MKKCWVFFFFLVSNHDFSPPLLKFEIYKYFFSNDYYNDLRLEDL